MPSSGAVLILESELFDNENKLSIAKMLEARDRHQSGTTIWSEHILELDPKFDKPRLITDDPDIVKLRTLSIKEGSHRVCVAQDMVSGEEKVKKSCQIRWQTVAKELAKIIPAKGGHGFRIGTRI